MIKKATFEIEHDVPGVGGIKGKIELFSENEYNADYLVSLWSEDSSKNANMGFALDLDEKKIPGLENYIGKISAEFLLPGHLEVIVGEPSPGMARGYPQGFADTPEYKACEDAIYGFIQEVINKSL